MRLLIDGDILKYRCGFAAEKGSYTLSREGHDDEAYTYKADLDKRIERLWLPVGGYSVSFSRVAEPVENALHLVRITIEGIRNAFQSSDLLVYLSGSGNFREGIATIRGYKANRDKNHRPVHGPAIVEYISDSYPHVVSIDQEADDDIGIAQFSLWQSDPYGSVIVTTDKDLDMIPGLHYNFVKKESYSVDLASANRAFYTQLLVGDPVDNIQGCPGIGPAKARRALADCDSDACMYKACRKLYKENDEALLENARLLWIRRKENELWQPPVM